jgi:fluoroquinolone resistance protein
MSDMSIRECENQTFHKHDWKRQTLKHTAFAYCRFENCDFTESNLTSAKFRECTMHHCNLSLIKCEGCRFQEISFHHCKCVGVNFGKCDPLFLAIYFENCLIDTCNFSDLSLKKAVFLNCTIRNTHFIQAHLIGANFSGSDLKGSIFHNCQLNKANFVGAIHYAINPSTNQLKQAKFSKPEVMSLLEHFDILIE